VRLLAWGAGERIANRICIGFETDVTTKEEDVGQYEQFISGAALVPTGIVTFAHDLPLGMFDNIHAVGGLARTHGSAADQPRKWKPAAEMFDVGTVAWSFMLARGSGVRVLSGNTRGGGLNEVVISAVKV
jgi:hypothetical protein